MVVDVDVDFVVVVDSGRWRHGKRVHDHDQVYDHDHGTTVAFRRLSVTDRTCRLQPAVVFMAFPKTRGRAYLSLGLTGLLRQDVRRILS